MNRAQLAALAMTAILPLSTSAVIADSQPSGAKANSKTSHSTSIAVTVGGFWAGFVVGTPICLVRRFYYETVEGAHGLVGDTRHKWLLVSAGAAWTPCAAFLACVEAPVVSWRNAWMADVPFSKEQFSLGEMEE